LVSAVDNEPVVEDEIFEPVDLTILPTNETLPGIGDPESPTLPTPTPVPTPSLPYPRVMTDIFGRDFFVPNDTAWRGEWDNFVNGTARGRNWGVEAINAPHAWMHWAEQDGGTWQINRERHSIIRVGVIDSFFLAHEDLTFVALFENNRPANPSPETLNHGIHVAGIIGADFNNGRGITGAAPNAELYGYSLHGTQQGEYAQFAHITSFNIMHGVGTLFANDVNVINISMSRGIPGGIGNYFQSLIDAHINLHTFDINAEQNRVLLVERELLTVFLRRYYDLGHDFIIVQSAGNNSNRLIRGNEGNADLRGRWVNTQYNGFFRNITDLQIRNRIIVVGNMENPYRPDADVDNFMANSSSQVGDRVDIFAPGTNILSTHLSSTQIGGVWLPYVELSGTSQAAPHVAGVVAMMWGVNPYLTGAELADLLLNNPLRNISLDDNGNVQIGAERQVTVRMTENGFNVQDPLVPAAITRNFPILDAAAAVNAALDATGTDRNITERSRLVSGVVVLPDTNDDNVVIEARALPVEHLPVPPPRRVSHNITDGQRLMPFALLLSTNRLYSLRVGISSGFFQRSYAAGIFIGSYDIPFLVIEPIHRIPGITIVSPIHYVDNLPQDEFIELVTPPFDFLSPSARRVDGRVMAPIAPLIEHGFGYELFFVGDYNEIRIYTHDNQRVVMQIGYDHFRVENLRPADTPTDEAMITDYAVFNYIDEVALQVINGSVFIPLRSLAEALGYTVHWDGETYTAAVMRPNGVSVQTMSMPMQSLMIESGTPNMYRWR